MAQKNETPLLLLSLVLSGGLLALGVWWLTQKSQVNLAALVSGSSSPSLNRSQPKLKDFSQVADVPTGQFKYGGSTTWAPMRGKIDPMLQAAKPGFQLQYTKPPSGSPPSSDVGIRMVIEGQLAFAQTSRPLRSQEIQQAKQRGLNLQEVQIAIDALAIAVHPSLTIPGLTLEQLRDIYTGKVQNWKAVGGPDLAIVPLSRAAGSSGTVDFFVEKVLANQALGSNIEVIGTTTEALQKVGKTRGSIYYASAPEVVPQPMVLPLPIGQKPGAWIPPYQGTLQVPAESSVRKNLLNVTAFQDGSYPLTRKLYVVFQQNGQIEQRAGEAYVNLLRTEQGRTALEDLGFVPLN